MYGKYVCVCAKCAFVWTMANYIDDINGVKWPTKKTQKWFTHTLKCHGNGKTVEMRAPSSTCTRYTFSIVVVMNFMRKSNKFFRYCCCRVYEPTNAFIKLPFRASIWSRIYITVFLGVGHTIDFAFLIVVNWLVYVLLTHNVTSFYVLIPFHSILSTIRKHSKSCISQKSRFFGGYVFPVCNVRKWPKKRCQIRCQKF